MDSFTDEAKLFIGGIGWDTTEERLRDHFSRYGEVAHAVVMRDRVTSQPRGFGFVVFSDPSVIPSVLQQTHNIDGRTVEAKRAMSREQQQTLKTGSNSTGGNFVGSENLKSKKIFVGGLPSTLNEDEFRGYFQDFGSVTDVVIMYDTNTGRPRGFGFISFTTEDSVDRVLQKTFHELKGKLVEVKRALPKDAVTGVGSRGSSRGYGSNFSSNEPYNSPIGNSRMLQQTQPTNGGYQPNQPSSGGYPPYSVYGGASYGYAGNSNPGYGAYGGYEVGGHGSANAGYSGPAGVYGNLGSPNTDFLKNQWSSQQAGYGASGYGQTANYGASVPWSNASRSSASGYAQAGRPPSGASQFVNKGYNYNGYGDDTSHAYAGGNAMHLDGSWKPENCNS
ncbi:heterogeneous nuclear ribonucleoprotein 1-like [Salvia divinorum]|uniref:Heterogeneous nuclear ribonucleoprotein 1-like n=1 Tax=Salvia divinorum TaxID=28513 RepID=A0ABD1HVQ5_SALDI